MSARQDLLGKELRQMFDGYVQEEMPDELMRLALQLQGAMETRDDATDPTTESDTKGRAPAQDPSES